MKDPRKVKAGRLGGRATLAKHGREHMRAIGRQGAKVTWERYHLAPFALANYAMVRRSDNKIIAIW